MDANAVHLRGVATRYSGHFRSFSKPHKLAAPRGHHAWQQRSSRQQPLHTVRAQDADNDIIQASLQHQHQQQQRRAARRQRRHDQLQAQGQQQLQHQARFTQHNASSTAQDLPAWQAAQESASSLQTEPPRPKTQQWEKQREQKGGGLKSWLQQLVPSKPATAGSMEARLTQLYQQIYLSPAGSAPDPEWTDFIGPVRVENVGGGKGRGLVAARDVAAGELLLACKPVVSGYGEVPDQVIMTRLTTRLGQDVELRNQVYDLYAGQKYQGAPKPLGVHPDHLMAIYMHNSFLERQMTSVCGSPGFDECISGMWLMPSFINHACISNAERCCLGNVMVLRATVDLKAGQELYIPYVPYNEPYRARQARMRGTWGFACGCELCREGAAMPRRSGEVLEECTAQLLQQGPAALEAIQRRTASPTDVLFFLQRLQSSMQQALGSRKWRLQLMPGLQWMAAVHEMSGNYKAAAKAYCQAYQLFHDADAGRQFHTSEGLECALNAYLSYREARMQSEAAVWLAKAKSTWGRLYGTDNMFGMQFARLLANGKK